MPKLTIVGLGPGTWESLTVEAAETLKDAGEVYVRTAMQPSLDPIRQRLPKVTFHSFDHVYESLSSLPEVYERIAEEVLRLASRPEGMVYAVPGSPSVGETTVQLLVDSCEAHGIDVRVIQGLSFVEPVLAAVEVADAGWVQVLDAAEAAALGSENAVGEMPDGGALLPWGAPAPTQPLLVSYLFSRSIASGVKLWLGRYYPDEHRIQVIRGAGTPQSVVETVPLHDLDRQLDIDHRTAVYVPPLADVDNVRTFSGIMQLTRRLRGPGGCPWDREQTHASLKPHLLEEAYEVIDALDSGDPEVLAEELGDLLYQITIHSQVAAEADEFTIEDVIQNIVAKMVGRHPHVFGDLHLESAQDVRHAWEGFKQRQKPERASVMEEIPKGLPALPQSNLMQKRAASVGFEWPSVSEVIAKVEEELDELRAEITSEGPKDQQREELGDILFALVSVARHLRIDPEEALRLANHKFAERFRRVEALVSAEERSLRELSPEELDSFWNQAKNRDEVTSP
jgi:tetrapyrrole methylase family protein/MazG family protein